MIRKMILGLLLMAFSLYYIPTSADTCNEELPITIENLSGTFVSANGPSRFTDHLTENEDGTFLGYIEDNGEVTWRYEGKWKLSGNKVINEITYSSLGKIPVGTIDEDEIIRIGCGLVTYRSSISGKMRCYKKIGD